MSESIGNHQGSAELNEARSLHANGKIGEAEAKFRGLLGGREDLDAQHGLALIFNQTGRSAEAIPILKDLLARDPNAISSRLVLARCLAATDNLAAAITECDLACKALPDNAVVWNLAGQLQQNAGDANAAVSHLRRALDIDPNFGPALHNYAIALVWLGDTLAAISAYEAAIRIMPTAARVHYHYALALQKVGRESDAMDALSRALDLRPEMADARLRLVHLMLLQCDWRDIDNQTTALRKVLDKLVSKDEIGHLSLHILNSLHVPARLHRRLARRMARGIARRAQNMAAPTLRRVEKHKRIRLAYLSPDLGVHAVGSLLKDFFAHHDAEKFCVCVFSLRNFDDHVASKIRMDAENFKDLSDCSLNECAERIAAFSPDIMVDLGGYTLGTRPELLAQRPAPIQISWLGYLNTMGAEFVDFIIADHTVLPPGEDDNYDEKIARLPRCFFPYSRLDDNSEIATRASFGLPEEKFVFASFNNTYKVQPEVFRAWVRILHETPDSVLWVHDGDRETVRQNLRKAFKIAGLESSRLYFAPMLPMDQHLQRMKLADLFLDTFHYNAGATAIASAQASLPVLTLKGDSLLARMGASINQALGLEEFICSNPDDYVVRASELARRPDKLRRARAEITLARKEGSGLFDTAGFVRDFEDLLEKIKTDK